MAEEKKAVEEKDQVQDLDELTRAAYSGLAVYANRFSINIGEGGVRISAFEQSPIDGSIHFRAAIQTSFAQAAALQQVLAGMLKDLEDKINESQEKAKLAEEKTEATKDG